MSLPGTFRPQQQTTKTIANEEGMSLLREVRQLARELEESKARITRLEAANPVEDMRLIRSAALDEWAGLPKQADNNLSERHIVAHGGRVRLDVDTIQSREHLQPERVVEWKKAFQSHYGVPFDRVVQKLDNLPEPITTAMDRRASAHHMRHWLKKRDLRSNVLQCANVVTIAWWERGARRAGRPQHHRPF